MLQAVEGGLYSTEVLEALEVTGVMRCVLLCMLEAVEGEFCLLEVLDVLEVMRCMLLCTLEAVESGFSFGVSALWQFSCYRPPPGAMFRTGAS